MASPTEKAPACPNKNRPVLTVRASTSELGVHTISVGFRKLALSGAASSNPAKQCMPSDSALQVRPRRTEGGPVGVPLPSPPVRGNIAINNAAAPIAASCNGKPFRAWQPGAASHGASIVSAGGTRECAPAMSPPMFNLQFSPRNCSPRPNVSTAQNPTPPLRSYASSRIGGDVGLSSQARLAKCKSESSLRLAGSALEVQRQRVVGQLMGELMRELQTHHARAFRKPPTAPEPISLGPLGGQLVLRRSQSRSLLGRSASQRNLVANTSPELQIPQFRGGNPGGRQRNLKRPLPDVEEGDSTPEDSSGPRLACPYYKHNPQKHTKNRSCAGPGWETVHRVKEHLYRQHKQAIHCTRCGMLFKSNDQLFQHSRLLETCQIRNFERPEGLTEREELNLRKRRKTMSSEEEKWRALFKILFPGVDERSIPSPYYGNKYPPWEEQADFERSRYEQYMERELPDILHRRLDYAVSGLVGPLESQLRGQLQDIIRESQAEALRSYRITNPPRYTPTPPSPKRSFESLDSSTSSLNSPVEIDWPAFIVPSPVMEHRYVNLQDIERGRPQ